MDPIVLDDEDIEMVARRADTEGSVHESEAQGCVVGEPGAGPSTTATLPILSPDGITGESTGNAGGVPEPRARASDPTEGNPDMDTTRSSLNPNHRAHNLADVGGGGSHGDGGLDMDENRTEPDEDGLSSPPPANAMSGVVSTPLPLVEPELEHSVGIGPPSAEGGPATAPPRLLRQTRANRTTSRSVPRRSSAGVGQERADRAMSEMRSRLRSRNTGTGAENPPEEPAPAPVADPEPEPELQMEEPPAGSVPDDAAQGSIAQQRARNAQQQADRIKVTMTAWSKDDSRIVVASTDHILRTFDSRRGELLCTMKQHDDEIYVIDIHPVDARIFLSAGHDGQLILWDIITGRALKTLLCDFSVLEARFSQDGMRIVAVDSMGYTHLFSAMDDLVVYQGVATEQFFPSDYNPLRMDANQWVVDEQMQIAPHLMPRVPVSSYFGVPWPAAVGRETEGLDAPTGLERGELEDELQRRLAQVEKERTKRQPVPHLHEDATRMEKEAKSLKRKLERQRRRGRGGTDFYSDDEQLLMFLDSPVAPLPESSEDEYGDQDTSSDEGSAGFDGNGSDSSGAAGQGRRTRRRRETRAQRRERRNRRRLRSQRGSDFDRSDQVGDDFRALDLDFLSDAEAEALGLRRRKNKKSYREVDSSGLDEGGDSDGAFELDGEGLSSRRRKRRRPTAGSSSAADATSSSVLPAAASTSTAPAPYPYPTKGKRKSRKGDFDFDPDAYLPTDWVSEVRPTDTPYRPQVGDKVVYIQAGHKAWLRAVKEGVRGAHGEYEVYPEPPDLVNRVTRELPWERKTANYPPIVFGVVKKIEYHVAPPAICRVDIEIHENTAASDNPEARSPANSDWSIQVLPPVESLTPTTSVLKVVYFDKDDCADFLVLFDRYMAGMSTTFQMGDPVLVRYSDGEEHEGLLVAKYAADGTLLAGEEPTLPKQRRTRLRPTGDPSSSATPMGGAAAPSASRSETHAQSRSESALSDPWSCFRVLWAEGNVEAFSPWELFKPGHPPPPLPRIDADEATAIMNAILRFAEDERHAVFVDPVNREDYPDYFRYIAYPMHLSMLVERLQNGFYRRFEALVWDIDRIRVNAMIYNDSDTDVYQLANIELKKLIEQVQAAREGRDRRLMTLRLRASNGPASGAPSVVSDSDAGSATGTAKRAITLTMRSTFSGSGSAEPRDESLEQGRRTRSSQATIAKSPQQEFVDNVPSESRSNLDGPGGHNLRSARSRAHVESVAAAAPLPAPRPARRILIRSGSAASNAGNNLRTGPNGTDFGAGSPRRPAAAESKATVFPMRSTRRSKEAQASEQMERVSDSDVDAGRKRTKTRSTPRRTLRIGSAGTEGMVPASPFLEPTETGHRDDAHTDDREDLPNDEFGDGGTDGQPRSEAGPVYEPPPPKPKAPRKRRSSDSDEPSDFEAGPDSAPSGASDEESSELSSVESDSDQARRKKKSSKAKRTAQKRTPARKRRKLVYSEESEESSAVETDDS